MTICTRSLPYLIGSRFNDDMVYHSDGAIALGRGKKNALTGVHDFSRLDTTTLRPQRRREHESLIDIAFWLYE